jgi:D-threo-aldose 1-dehydrogenase
MPTRLVGKAGVRIPLLGLGCAPLANYFNNLPEQQVEDLICYSFEKGASFYDTAPQYGYGLSEKRLGQALYNVPRDAFTLATKVGRVVEGEKKLKVDYTHDGILRSLEESLNRLKLGRIDIAHIHDPDNHFREALDMAFPTLAELRSQGVIRAIGAGMNQWQMLLEFARSADFDCFMLAGRYTLLEQKSLPLLDYCQQKGIAIFLGGVYNTGILATGAIPGARYNYHAASETILDRVRRIEAVCQKYAIPLRAAALQFPVAHSAVTSLVVGAESREEFAQTFDGLCVSIPNEFWQDLHAAGLIDEKAPVPEIQ